MTLGEWIQSADWKGEKHVPVIELLDEFQPGKEFRVEISVGKEIPHPNTIEHHIKWIDLYVKFEDSKFVVHLAHFEFTPVTTQPRASITLKLEKPGKLIAVEHCNIHGLWENSIDL